MKNLVKLIALFILFGSATMASAAVIYVDTDASGSNNGLSWTNAYTDLQDGLAAASSGDEIWVANGVYKPTSTTNRSISFVIPDGVSIFGGFAGGETTRVERDWNANATILSGAIGSQVDVTDNTETLISIPGASDDILISGFKIQRAYGDFLSNVSITNCSQVRFRQCDFRINYSGGYNFYVQFSKVDFNDCLFRDNEGASIIAVANEGIVNDINSTWSDNIGYSIYFTTADESYVTMQNAVVSGNDLVGPVCSTGNFSQAENCVITEPSLGFTNTSNISTDDPLFVDPASNNFKLLPASPAIGHGDNNDTSQGYDLAHELRIQGTDVDAGCYEANVPTTIYVDVDATGLDNGANWANAFNDLQDALAVAEAGDEVWVAEGIYYPTSTTQRSVRFVLADEVKLYGGFDATETNRNQRNWIENLTILSGDIGAANVQTDNSYHVVMAANASGDSHIDGFVIEDGYANSGSLNGEGGGISIQATTNCEIRNCWLRNNFALRGGGIHVRLTNGEVTIGQSVFQFNEGNEGAGLYFDDDVDVESCFFSGNTTNTTGTVYGVQNFDLEMTNCTFFNNTLPVGSRVIDGNGTNDVWDIVNCIIWGNSMDAGLEPIRNVGPNTDVRLSIVQNGHTGGTQVFDQDPLFMNPVGGDFGLQPSSVGFNAGDDSVVEEALDAVRNDRIRVGQVDFGAVESSGTPASVIYVDQDATGANNGSSWANAYTSLYDALDVAVDGDHVWVAEGTYTATSQYFTAEGIELHGGFNGTETLLSQANWEVNETIISGDLGVQGVETDNASQLLRFELDADPVVVSGFVFQDGYSEATNEYALEIVSQFGFVGESNIDMYNCVFRQLNWLNGSYPAGVISNSSLSNTINADIENCLFYEIQSINRIFGQGNSGAILSLTGCTFANNTINSMFGGIVTGPKNVNNCIFWDNSGGSNSSFTSTYGVPIEGSNNIYQGGSITGTNNQIVDPLFVNSAANDFNLMPLSPAIGMGDNGLVTVDFDLNHNDRIQFTNVDAGAFESTYGEPGCTDEEACNYGPSAETNDGSCTYPACLDPLACNYEPTAPCADNGQCTYDCIPAVPGVVYVDEGAFGDNDGSSWANAFNTIFDALGVVQAGEEVWVAEGTYFASGTNNLNHELYINPDVLIFGGFNATETARNQRDYSTHETIISGELGAAGLTDNTETIIRFSAGTELSILDGFTITRAYSELAPPVISNSAFCGLRNCIFTDMYYSGYLFSHGGTSNVVLENCLIHENWNTSASGSIFSAGVASNVSVINCTIANNEGTSLGNSAGSSSLAFENCIVWGHDFSFLLSGSNLSVRNSITDDEVFTGVDENVIHEDPLFVGGGSFILQSNSPAVGLGDNSESFAAFDLAKNQRIQNAGIDAGAYESPYLLSGCTNNAACNYNPNADTDDGSCGDGCVPNCLGDFNYDGIVNASDLLQLLASFSTSCGFPYCSGDMNGDTLVDTSDLLDFLGVFGTPCN